MVRADVPSPTFAITTAIILVGTFPVASATDVPTPAYTFAVLPVSLQVPTTGVTVECYSTGWDCIETEGSGIIQEITWLWGHDTRGPTDHGWEAAGSGREGMFGLHCDDFPEDCNPEMWARSFTYNPSWWLFSLAKQPSNPGRVGFTATVV